MKFSIKIVLPRCVRNETGSDTLIALVYKMAIKTEYAIIVAALTAAVGSSRREHRHVDGTGPRMVGSGMEEAADTT